MDVFMDAALLSRIQFAGTAIFHFFFVPLSIGLGLILAIHETRYYKTRSPEDEASAKLWLKIFTATFVVGVATGITMEFSFGTNWADYSRFVGDIFGAPLAAEALLAFFLESVFLGILLFGRKKVSPKFYLVSAWLVFAGSALSALWILIANSWMQTPAGAMLSADGTKAIITDFFAAAFNPSTLSRYTHVLVAVLIMGAFMALAVAAWYLHKGKHQNIAMKTMRIGATVAIVSSCAMIFTAHSSAVVVAEQQPSKLAMMEGMYEEEVPPLYLFGWVNEETQETTGLAIPGGTSFLATWTWDTSWPGLNDLAATEQYGDLDPAELPVNFVFQTYHLMVLMYGLIMLSAILAIIFSFRKEKIKNMRWLQKLLIISPVFPFIAIQTGWLVAEIGRQPWVVYPSEAGPQGISLLINNAYSQSVSGPEIVVTLVLFFLIYLLIFVAWIRVLAKFIKQGPVLEAETKEDIGTFGSKPSASLTGAAAGSVGKAASKAKGGE